MKPTSRFTRGGGCLLAFALIGGVMVGAWAHESSIGFLGGLGLGLAALLVLWLMDRRQG
ncbi:MAG TPA: hypothetical protein VEW04_03740 [Allosphingosinicella sp.]|nr:hypothetical protein [Allosphingosinicella sp.]